MAALAIALLALAQSPYHVELSIDLPLIGVGAAGSLVAFIELPPAPCLPDCDESRINGFDRKVLGNYSPTAHEVANYTVLSLVLLPQLLDLLDSGGDGFAEDFAVAVETFALTQAFTQLTKVAVRRTAPFVYNDNVSLETRTKDPDAVRSFFSGHTATSFSAVAEYATTFWLRHPDSPYRWLVIGLGAAIATAVGVLKIKAGYHFFTDIAAGAIAGTSIGVLVPLLHAEL